MAAAVNNAKADGVTRWVATLCVWGGRGGAMQGGQEGHSRVCVAELLPP